jgi:tRNA threonylcarbamoyladenosine biosynthesis protein TsaE
MRRELRVDGEEAMVAFGSVLGSRIEAPLVVFLEGDLGAGKTTLARGVLRALGHTGAVKSPTYTLVEPYSFAKFTLYHFDLYRLGESEELEYMGIRDYFDSDAIALVEWPERGLGHLPAADLVVSISVCGNGRVLTFEASTLRGVECLGQLLLEPDLE